MFGNFGPGEIFLVLAVLLLIFGAKRLPELGGALGKGIREFKQSVREIGSGSKEELGSGSQSRAAVPPPQTEAPPTETTERNGG